MAIIGLIPARGGSKGIPRKNLANLNGQPLISYSINSGLKSKYIDKLIVSTDDIEIANISKNLGAEVPFIRPQKLSDDFTPIVEVLNHCLNWFKKYDTYIEALVLLQPTSPLRKAIHIDQAIKLFRSNLASSVVSVVKVPHQYSPFSVMKINNDKTLNYFLKEGSSYTRRQDKPDFFARNGPSILVTKPEIIRQRDLYGNKCYPYVMDPKDSIDIDSYEDLLLADMEIKKRINES